MKVDVVYVIRKAFTTNCPKEVDSNRIVTAKTIDFSDWEKEFNCGHVALETRRAFATGTVESVGYFPIRTRRRTVSKDGSKVGWIFV